MPRLSALSRLMLRSRCSGPAGSGTVDEACNRQLPGDSVRAALRVFAFPLKSPDPRLAA
jgi:hypothetical protein